MIHYIRSIIILITIIGVSQNIRAEDKVYTDLTLNQAVSIAVEKNRDIANAEEDVRRANLQVTEAASTAFPQLNGLFQYDRNLKPMVRTVRMPDFNDPSKTNTFKIKFGQDNSMQFGATLSQPLYVGGKVGTALKAAKIYRTIADKTLLSVKQNVIAGALTAFNTALLMKEMSTIQHESLAQAEKHRSNVQNLYAVGKATDYDLLRARVQVANMKPKLLEAENQATISLYKLKEVLGIQPDVPFSITGTFSEPDTTIFSLSPVETAFEKRPDLTATRYTIDLQEKAVGIAKGDFLPTLTAGSTFAYSGDFDTFRYHKSDWFSMWTASLTLSFPIFSGFKNTAKYQQAQVDYRKAYTDFVKTQDAVLIEVREGVLNLQKAIKAIESQQLNVEEAQKALELAESLYTNGKATQLEVLDTQLALEVAKTNMANALYEGTIAEVNLKKSLGIIDINM